MRTRLGLIVVVLATVAWAQPAHAGRADWRRLSGDLARPWPSIQTSAGNFPDYTDGEVPRATGRGTRYGDSVLALALLQRGLRSGDKRLIDSATKAFAFVISRKRRRLQRYKPSVFESMAVAAGYNLLRKRLPGNPVFRRNRRAWERWLLRVRPVSTILRMPSTRRFGNHYLVEAIEVFELRRTGLHSRNRAALLGPRLGRAMSIYRRLINHGIPALGRRKGQSRHGVPTFLISDPPDYPLAYQGLAVGLYAHALQMIGGGSRAARATLRRAVNASWLIAAPDGDLGYFGRSSEESWTQSGTALGAEVAVRRAGATGRSALRYRALRERALGRLRDAYGFGPRGYHFIPALEVSDRLGARALEPYAGSPSFGGLTLLLLNWTLTDMPTRDKPVGAIAASRGFQAELSRGQSTFAMVRRGRAWFTVREGQSRPRRPGDLRYDFGLVAVKARAPGHGWRDVMPLRPLTYSDRSAGPVLRRGGARGYPFGSRMRIRHGVVTVYGGFRTPGGRWPRPRGGLPFAPPPRGARLSFPGPRGGPPGGRWLRRGVAFRFAPTSCGARLSFRGRRGDRLEYSSFLRSYRQGAGISRAELTDSLQRVTASPRPGAVHVDGKRYYSASD